MNNDTIRSYSTYITNMFLTVKVCEGAKFLAARIEEGHLRTDFAVDADAMETDEYEFLIAPVTANDNKYDKLPYFEYYGLVGNRHIFYRKVS